MVLLAFGNAVVPTERIALAGNPFPASEIAQLLMVLLLFPVEAPVEKKITPEVITLQPP